MAQQDPLAQTIHRLHNRKENVWKPFLDEKEKDIMERMETQANKDDQEKQ